MSKQTKKFKVVTEEHLVFTHVIEVPISLLDEYSEYADTELDEYFVENHYPEFIEYPDMKSKTITNVEWVGYDTQVDVEEINDE